MRLLVAPALLSCALAAAAQPLAFPAMGQSAQQQEQDTVACQARTQQAGGPDTASAGGDARNAAGAQIHGAVADARLGGVAGGINDPSGEAAAAGAALGPRAGRSTPAAAQASMRDQAFAACMSRRGYTLR